MVRSPPHRVTAIFDRSLSARLLDRRPLLYDVGPDSVSGRPPHVRAASALAWVGPRLVVIQDDALFLALVDPKRGTVGAVTLPAGARGARLFDERSGNKLDKLDLEAAIVVSNRLVAFGSGSTPAREQIVVVSGLPESPDARVLWARAFYAELRENESFAGSELNLEGAAVVGDRIVLLQRGNGRVIGDRVAVNATAHLDASQFVSYLAAIDTAASPQLEQVTHYDLGAVSGIPFTFTDVASFGERLVYLAAAENSPDTVRDGVVVGAAVGVIERDGSARYAPIIDVDGRTFVGKAEGIALDPAHGTRAFIVLDCDDPDEPAELCTVELAGL